MMSVTEREKKLPKKGNGRKPKRESGGEVVSIAMRRRYALTDIGNGERFASMFQERVRYCHPWGSWIVRTTGGWWQTDESGAVHQLAKECVRGIYTQASRSDEEAKRKAIAAHAAKSESRSRVEGLLALAKSEPGIPVLPAALDSDPWLFGCQNGVLDLRTASLRAYLPEDLITKVSPVAFDASAKSPTWDAFLERVLPDAAVRTFVQRWFGYSMLGIVRHHLLPIWPFRGRFRQDGGDQ